MDRSIEEAAAAILRESPYPQLRQVRCEFSGGVLILHGQLPTFHLKQLAQTVVQSLDEDVDVDNRIEVRPAGQEGK